MTKRSLMIAVSGAALLFGASVASAQQMPPAKDSSGAPISGATNGQQPTPSSTPSQSSTQAVPQKDSSGAPISGAGNANARSSSTPPTTTGSQMPPPKDSSGAPISGAR